MAEEDIVEERIIARLNNIRSVEPILSAMRTISLGSWQAALKRQQRVRSFSERLLSLLPAVGCSVSALPHLTSQGRKRRTARLTGVPPARRARSPHPPAPTVVLVVGSERGLCGAFNTNLIHYAQEAFDRYEREGIHIELATLGRRVGRALERRGVSIVWSRSLPISRLPGRELASELTDTWLARYEAHTLDAVDVIYNAYLIPLARPAEERAGVRGFYRPVTTRLIPPDRQHLAGRSAVTQDAVPWPPPYIDTDPVMLYTYIIRLWITTEMYRILLDSAAAEHATRFQLMEGATQNSRRLIDELTLALQAARQQAITSEMQELAAGAGLLGS